METHDRLKALLATVTGPRYTSYPTADRFTGAVAEPAYRQALAQRRYIPGTSPLSLYVHIPFCRNICYYCACNKVITRQADRSQPYLEALFTEIDAVALAMPDKSPVFQLHLGGGTPTFLADAQLELLVLQLESRFPFDPRAERGIEVDPRTVDGDRLSALRAMGFNRLSFGIQDFNPQTQRAVNRIQSFDSVARLVESARDVGFESINVDFILGLPHQTRLSWQATLIQALQLRPDRVALYSYAHLPDRFKPQRRILAADLPSLDDKLVMQAQAIEMFQAAGYEHIGMDHFALPTDELAVARRQGRLHRNFQGYTTWPEADMLGFGVSAIGRVGATFVQNERDIEAYEARVRAGQLPVARGHVCSMEDLIRQRVIMTLMCQGYVDFEALGTEFLIDANRHFAAELSELTPYVEQGHLVRHAQAIELTASGWFLVRNMAMVFDRYWQTDRRGVAYSRVF